MADEGKEIAWEEIHFSPIPSQTNIYGLTKVEGREEGNKVFLASLSGRVICLEYQQNWLVPSAREVPFTYIPADSAEIVSIDAFKRPEPSKQLVVGISLILLKNSRSHQKQFLNIYSALESKAEFSLESIAEGCQHFELDFVPFQLTHAEIFVKGRKEVVFLLCGSDQSVHMFCEDRVQQRFEEQPVADYFPELQNLASNVLWLEVQIHQSRRITVLGCQDGHVKLAVIELAVQPSVIKEYNLNRDGPISSVKLFSLNPGQAHKPGEDHPDVDNTGKESSGDFNLLVCCTIEASIVFMDVINQGFSNMVTLPESDDFDSVTCACIADVDWDGCDEIILGTYGQEILVYKCVVTSANNVDFTLIWRRSFANPLFAVEYLDLTNDGVKEIAVASLAGLHVLQHNVDRTEKELVPEMNQTTSGIC
ncbi:KICSTOR complex protein kaptin-like isoform X1 [Acropora palmata]|uniref:KICSTOR complex protein kaptin-like isoform X1 n=1 Tax=Acropora palmata TaxID=6131 RepID=UPI003DA19DE2